MSEVVYFDYFDLSLFSPYFIEPQECNKCFKIFSPEIDLLKHLSGCRGLVEDADDADEDDFIDDVYDDEDEYY